MIVALHLGAGSHSKEHEGAYKKEMKRICNLVFEVILAGKDAASAVQYGLQCLEGSHLTNAGIPGSNACVNGIIEGDASIMCNGNFGSVGAVPLCSVDPQVIGHPLLSLVPSPSQIAFEVWKKQTHGLDDIGRVPPLTMAGIAAQHWAASIGLETISNLQAQALVTTSQQERYHRHLSLVNDMMNSEPSELSSHLDTVGVIVMDSNGLIASGVSSGGISMKLPGRIGHAAQFGCGVWASNDINDGFGINATGTGEHIILSRMTSHVADAFQRKDTCLPLDTVNKTNQESVIGCPLIKEQASVGLLFLHSSGGNIEVGWAHTTPSMAISYKSMHSSASILSRNLNHHDVCIGGSSIKTT